jgi:hypothetical protein
MFTKWPVPNSEAATGKKCHEPGLEASKVSRDDASVLEQRKMSAVISIKNPKLMDKSHGYHGYDS